jgi:hypothetical protein
VIADHRHTSIPSAFFGAGSLIRRRQYAEIRGAEIPLREWIDRLSRLEETSRRPLDPNAPVATIKPNLKNQN